MAEDRQPLLPPSGNVLDLSGTDSGGDDDPRIVFAAVAMGSVILARHTPYDGNFEDMFEHLLQKLGPNDKKITFLIDSDQDYMYHLVQEDDGLVFVCITDDDFPRPKAFLFLEDIKRKFRDSFKSPSRSSLPYSLNSRFSYVLDERMNLFSSQQEVSLITSCDHIQQQVEEMEEIGIRNLDTQMSLNPDFSLPQFEVSNEMSSEHERRSLLSQVSEQFHGVNRYGRSRFNLKKVITLMCCLFALVTGILLVTIVVILLACQGYCVAKDA